MEVEELMVQRLEREPELSIHSMDFLCWLHREFYQRLPEEMRFSTDRQGKPYRVEPGAIRHFEVEVGKHQPPHFGSWKNSWIVSTSFTRAPEY